jgi:hypothetical protein
MFVVVLVPGVVHPDEASAVSATITRKAVTERVFLNSVCDIVSSFEMSDKLQFVATFLCVEPNAVSQRQTEVCRTSTG